MPQENLYVERTDDEGVSSYVLLSEAEELGDIALSDDVIAKTSQFQRVDDLHKKAVGESKKRLRRAQTAEQALKDLDGDDNDTADDSDEPKSESAPPQQPSYLPQTQEELFAQFSEWQGNKQAQASAAQNEKDTELKGLMQQHKLGDEALVMLRTSTAPAELAAFLGRSKYNFDENSGGETVPSLGDDFGDRLAAKLQLPAK